MKCLARRFDFDKVSSICLALLAIGLLCPQLQAWEIRTHQSMGTNSWNKFIQFAATNHDDAGFLVYASCTNALANRWNIVNANLAQEDLDSFLEVPEGNVVHHFWNPVNELPDGSVGGLY